MMKIADADDIRADIAKTLEPHSVVLFMKGTPSRPQRGFSAAIVDVLQHDDVPVHAIDVLPDPPSDCHPARHLAGLAGRFEGQRARVIQPIVSLRFHRLTNTCIST
jgi:hypothetical protein